MQPIEIVGGGLAGLALGLALRRAGIAVTLFEAGDFPRHRVCGEFIAGLDAVTIDALQLAPFLEGAAHHRSVAWVTPDGDLQPQTLPAVAYGISRYELDRRLAEAFVQSGGDLRTRTRVADPRPRAGRVCATGRKKSRSAWLGLKIHAIGLRLGADLEVHLGDHAYVGLSRVENDRVNVCGLFRGGAAVEGGARRPGGLISESPPRRRGPSIFFEYLHAAGLDRLAERLRGANLDARSFAAVAALGFNRTLPRRDGLCIGDACAMIPPFTGNGMSMAFQSAATALPPLVKYTQGEATWEEATRTVQQRLARRFRTRLFAAGALHPFLLRPQRQRGLAALSRAGLLPFRPLFAVLH